MYQKWLILVFVSFFWFGRPKMKCKIQSAESMAMKAAVRIPIKKKDHKNKSQSRDGIEVEACEENWLNIMLIWYSNELDEWILKMNTRKHISATKTYYQRTKMLIKVTRPFLN